MKQIHLIKKKKLQPQKYTLQKEKNLTTSLLQKHPQTYKTFCDIITQHHKKKNPPLVLLHFFICIMRLKEDKIVLNFKLCKSIVTPYKNLVQNTTTLLLRLILHHCTRQRILLKHSKHILF